MSDIRPPEIEIELEKEIEIKREIEKGHPAHTYGRYQNVFLTDEELADLYRILRFLQNYGAVLITTETNLQYELYLTGLESRILARAARTRKRVPWEVAVDAD